MAPTLCALCKEFESSNVIYKDKYCFCVADKYPLKKGHLLIIPVRHITRLDELTEKESKAIFSITDRIRRTYPNKFGQDFFLLQNPVPRRSQAHIHFHILPYRGKVDFFNTILFDLTLRGSYLRRFFKKEITPKDRRVVSAEVTRRLKKAEKVD
jgi:diadenosine tetraphosphate (Ap4A) HIT family hydrolase